MSDFTERAKALSKLQQTYVRSLGVLGVLFLWLIIEYPRGFILSIAPYILPLLILSFFGSARAFGHAIDKIEKNVNWKAEYLDTHPNFLDMIAYTTKKTGYIWCSIAYMIYPLFVTIIFIESIYIWFMDPPSYIPCLLFIGAAKHIVIFWISRIKVVIKMAHIRV